MELAIRENVSAEDIEGIVREMVAYAQSGKKGSVGAAKLILDKFLPNAKDTDEDAEGGKQFVFRVENATVQVSQTKEPDPNEKPIEGEFHSTTEEDTNGQAEP